MVFFIYQIRKQKHGIGEIGEFNELKEKVDPAAQNRTEMGLNPQNVPDHLKDLIPMAEKWGIGDDVIRTDFEEKASAEEKEEFKNKLKGRTAEVSQWLDSFNDDKPMSEEAGSFMFMLEALDEMGIWPD